MRRLRVGLCFDEGTLSQPSFRRFVRSNEVIILPELFQGGYAALRNPRRGDDGRRLAYLQSLTNRFPFYCVAGSALQRHKRKPATNTCLVFYRGRRIHRYDKVHLFKPSGDHHYFAPGQSVKNFRLRLQAGIFNAGVIICYDLRFPELARTLALQGAKVLFVPARWPAIRNTAWRTLLQARAIENQIYVIGCNARGREGGKSYAFDPLGNSLPIIPSIACPSAATVAINLDLLQEARNHHNNLRDAVLLK